MWTWEEDKTCNSMAYHNIRQGGISWSVKTKISGDHCRCLYPDSLQASIDLSHHFNFVPL